MTRTPPDWLLARNGTLRPSIDGQSVFVSFGQQPQYELTPVPVEGKFGCRIIQTINGKPIPCAGVSASPAEAIRGGLETLRAALGW